MWRWALVGAGLLAAVCAVGPVGGPGAHRGGLRRPPEAASGEGVGEGAGRKRIEPEGIGREGGGRANGGRVNGGAGPGPPPGAWTARVVRVVDGDTLILRVGGRGLRVRLIGVDAPETWSRHECFGAEAARALRRLTPAGAEVRVAADREPYDRFGRRLLHLWTGDGRLVAADLVRTGFSRTLVIPPNTRYAPVLRAAQAAARRTRVGLWGACHGSR
ncbi:thermonuclease family protein [Actinoallomurus spadix]|nr:thermonuclease family protein [Actinoallomurus spadix]MCO5985104.1 thermonuclease family protein [Actinoallomurus spadix]